jgi:hypothetical protein
MPVETDAQPPSDPPPSIPANAAYSEDVSIQEHAAVGTVTRRASGDEKGGEEEEGYEGQEQH